MSKYRFNIIVSVILAVLIAAVVTASYFLIIFVDNALESMKEASQELNVMKGKTRLTRKVSPELKKASDQLKNYILQGDDSLYFLDYLEKEIQAVATSSSIVSVQPKTIEAEGSTVLLLNINSKTSLENILNLLRSLESIKYLSYIEQVNIERVPRDKDMWQVIISFVVFTR